MFHIAFFHKHISYKVLISILKYELHLQSSPICVNVTPLQVELLEKDLQDIKASLQEAKTHNQYLSNIIEQQKKLVVLRKKKK